jgi:hypothetical protein
MRRRPTWLHGREALVSFLPTYGGDVGRLTRQVRRQRAGQLYAHHGRPCQPRPPRRPRASAKVTPDIHVYIHACLCEVAGRA